MKGKRKRKVLILCFIFTSFVLIPQAHAEDTTFDSCGTIACPTTSAPEEEGVTTELIEDPTEGEQTNADQSTPVPTTGPQRPIPPRILLISKQVPMRYMRREQLRHRHQRHRGTTPSNKA